MIRVPIHQTMFPIPKRRENSKQSTVIVILDGVKVSAEKKGVSALCRAMSNGHAEILVLTLLHVKASESDPGPEFGKYNQSSETDSYIRFLQEEISQRKEVYREIFRPFYYACESNGVKFQVKIAAGFPLKDIIVEESNNAKATEILMDSSLARYLRFQLNGTDCDVLLVNDDEFIIKNEGLESSIVRDMTRDSGSSKLTKVFRSKEEPFILNLVPAIGSECRDCSASLLSSISKDIGHKTRCNPYEKSRNLSKHKPSSQDSHNISDEHENQDGHPINRAYILLGLPLQLGWEVIMEMSQGFKSEMRIGKTKNCSTYCGYFNDCQCFVLVKRFRGDSDGVLEAEKKAALSLHHKNIMTLIGYHRSENGTILVFPFVHDLIRRHWELTFQDKMKIAIEIGQALRYMHEECPRGPTIHGDLRFSNIFLTIDLHPMISGFAHAKWLRPEQELDDYTDDFASPWCQTLHPLDHRAMEFLKSDILYFGVLLLRLFCRKEVPVDDKMLIEWARPFLVQGAFHVLLDESSDDLDIHELYRVMTIATLCIKINPASRPSMSEILSILKGETFCAMHSSP